MSKDAISTDWVDPDDVPELTDAWFDKADLKVGDKLIRKGGRPAQDKQQVTLRLDRTILDHFRADGPGWQTRLNDALRRSING